MNRNILQVLKDRTREIVWSLSSDQESHSSISWPLDREMIEDCVIRWPSAYQWPLACKWGDHLLYGFQGCVRTEIKEIPQPYSAVVLFQFVIGENSYDVAVDYSDYSSYINEDAARQCALYFKMQYYHDGYPSDHIVPGGFVPGGGDELYQFVPHVRAIRDRKSFSYDVYGRFNVGFGTDIRRKAIQLLSKQNEFKYEGGFGNVRYSRFLREVAQAKICIDLPGNGDICFRLIDYLAIGTCVIRPRPKNKLHVPLVDGTHIIYTNDDLSDLVPLCNYYLHNDNEREMISQTSRQFFDKYLHRKQLVAYYLYCCLERCGGRVRRLSR